MKRYIAAAIAALVFSTSVRVAGDAGDVETRYRRSSMCSMLLKHTSDKYADEIEEQFMKIPVSDKYNDHNLSVRVITIEDKKGLKTEDDITAFVERNDIGSRLVGKWFNRNISTAAATSTSSKSADSMTHRLSIWSWHSGRRVVWPCLRMQERT